MSDAHAQYKETQILTASPGKLIVMLYDGAISSMQAACEFITKKEHYDKANSQLIKAQEIIGELLSSLDLKVGGDFASKMQSLYAYMIKRLMEANFKKDKEPVLEVLKYMQDLRESWAIAAQKTGSDPKQQEANNSSSNFNISG
ncbi:MAG: flagellar export chaperone FliS [Spirochaetae bacterium HGW-Spirochaetae-6]|nr:MAG: flagellar export chaperone FliS [Spirochaetae bacterium HGW-Spirochaetae-6]